jgi:hypothetical protein
VSERIQKRQEGVLHCHLHRHHASRKVAVLGSICFDLFGLYLGRTRFTAEQQKVAKSRKDN